MNPIIDKFNEWYKNLEKNQKFELIQAAKVNFEEFEKKATLHNGKSELDTLINFIVDKLNSAEDSETIEIETEIDSTIGECIFSYVEKQYMEQFKISKDITIINLITDLEQLKEYCEFIINYRLLPTVNIDIDLPFNPAWENNLLRFVGNVSLSYVVSFNPFEYEVTKLADQFSLPVEKISAILTVIEKYRNQIMCKFLLQELLQRETEIRKLKQLLPSINDLKNK